MNHPRMRVARLLLAGALMLVLGVAATGCASMGVQPWEHDVLAEPGMQVDKDAVLTALDEHIYFSKEASTGSLGGAGGGCGCN